MCSKEGIPRAATVVDHIIPHKGDQKLFWNQDNWQPLCKTHHDSHKQAFEKSGRVIRRIGIDGLPVGDTTGGVGKR
jgi:5-methylcytosine-specific restriction endonuclease McrA